MVYRSKKSTIRDRRLINLTINLTLVFKWYKCVIQFNLKIDRLYVKGYGFLSFAKNMVKNLINKQSQNHLDSANKSTTDVIKTASKRATQKRVEETGDLIGNKIADKTKGILKLHLQSTLDERDIPNERYISPEKKQ